MALAATILRAVKGDERRRIALLEEALARALDWMREQDTFPTDPSDESSWDQDIADSPSLAVMEREVVRDAMRRGSAIVSEGLDLLGGTEGDDNALARSILRARARERDPS